MSAWISHVKAYASKHKVSYKQAMSAAKASYKGKGSATKAAPTTKGKKKGVAELGGKKIKFNKGGLHKSLKAPEGYKFKKSELRKLNKVEVGDMFTFQGQEMKMTSRIKKQLTLGLNLMK
jgi:hypothetical protein